MARAFVLLLVILTTVTRTASNAGVPNAELVSLVRSMATPEKYDGKAVQVVGFLRLEFEGNGLYLHQEDYEHGITKNAVWVDRNAKINDRADALNMHYVMLGGTFDASDNGHMGLFSGSLKDIRSATPWRPRLQKRSHTPE
jgi:hypothetical protein